MPTYAPYSLVSRPSAFSSLVEEPLWAYAAPTSTTDVYQVVSVVVITENTLRINGGQFWANAVAPNSPNGIWIETSYSSAYRSYYAGIGYAYYANSDQFVPAGAQPPTINPPSASQYNPTTPICFTRGTYIQIGEQSNPVESLSISNQVSTTTASAAVKWIGYQRRTPEFAAFQDYLPVKISAGALDDNLPLRDLYLSPDHAVLVDGHLIHAKALVNGKTIVQMTEWAGDIEYYHIETEAHEIIYAEGVPCETFIDNVSREQFDNYAEYQALYPNTRMMKELPLPRVKFKRQLPLAIKQRLESRISELDRQKKG